MKDNTHRTPLSIVDFIVIHPTFQTILFPLFQVVDFTKRSVRDLISDVVL